MKRIMTRLLLAFMAVGFVACGKSKTGSVDQLDIFVPVTLTSTSGETLALNPGSQPAGAWQVKYNGKKKPPMVALKSKQTGEVYPVSEDDFSSDVRFLSSSDATTPWQDGWNACWRETFSTVCNSYGHCWTQVHRVPGTQRVRERRVGTMDTYEADVSTKSGSKAAYMKFTFDETYWEQDFMSACF